MEHSRLRDACREGKLEEVKYLIAENENCINERDLYGATFLHHTCRFNRPGNIDIVRFLTNIDRSLVNKKTNGGFTPLHYVCCYGNIEIAKILIENGGSKHINDKNRNGDTPLHLSSGNRKKLDIVKLLIKNGADTTITNNRSQTPLDCLFDEHKLEIKKIIDDECLNTKQPDI